jgi:spore coat protein U-like protein
MKKILAIVLTALMLATLSLTAIAVNTTGGEADITTSIAPSYTVTIPANTAVAFKATETAFGAIEVTAAQIHPDKCIKVALASDGKLENSIDNTKVIPYFIKDASGAAFTSATYLAAGESTELYIHITTNDWNAAYAGEYSDTVTFTVSYVDKD